MTILYHGTQTVDSISIARSGAILSPLDVRIEMFEEALQDPNSSIYEFFRKFPDKTIEEYALKTTCLSFGEHEIEHRLKSISMARRVNTATDYAMRFDYSFKKKRGEFIGGVVLGIDVDEDRIEEFQRLVKSNGNTIYVPRRLDLDELREIHLSPMARKYHRAQIRHEFARYYPRYFCL